MMKDLSPKALMQSALNNSEGVLSLSGALRVETGKRTGRSPKDRFIVDDELTHDTVDWGAVNQPIAPNVFDNLWKKAEQYLADKESYCSHLRVGACPEYFLPVRVVTETAWQNLFAQHLFIRANQEDYAEQKPVWNILNVAGLTLNGEQDGVHSDGAVLIF